MYCDSVCVYAACVHGPNVWHMCHNAFDEIRGQPVCGFWGLRSGSQVFSSQVILLTHVVGKKKMRTQNNILHPRLCSLKVAGSESYMVYFLFIHYLPTQQRHIR